MSPSAGSAARERLGSLLKQRRVELGIEFKNRSLFAAEVGLNYRLVQDIENAARDNFEDVTLLAIDRAYRWQGGSSARVLDGGDPEPMVFTPQEQDVIDRMRQFLDARGQEANRAGRQRSA
jgi:hypothetical protein